MAIQEMELDPNAATYTDDQIVGKVNSATANITRAGIIEPTAASALVSDDILEGTTNKYDTGAPPSTTDDLTEGSTNLYNSDQTGAEIQTAILGLDDATRKLIKTDPQAGEFTVLSIQRKSTGKLGTKYDDVAV